MIQSPILYTINTDPMFLIDDKIKGTDFTPTLRGKQLLLDPDTRRAFQQFRTVIPLTDSDFQQYYTATVESFAEYVQNLPATRYSLYAEPFGFLHLGVDRAIICTKQALKAYFDIQNLTPDQLSAHQHAELFAVFSAALLNDLGLLNLRFRIYIKNRIDQITPYDPYSGPMPALGKAFSVEFLTPELSDWQAPGSLILARQVLAHTGQNYKNSAFAWLSGNHQVLQFWYNLMLSISPREEDETRRTMLTLIPRSDAVLFQKFVSDANTDMRAGFLTNRPHNLLFQEPLTNTSNDLRDETLRLMQSGAIPSNEYDSGSMAATDATNSRILGSLGAANAPRLAVGLAFLRWLQTSLQNGQLRVGDEQSALIFRNDKGLVLNWAKITAAYAKNQSLLKQLPVTQENLLKDLHKLALSSTHGLALRDFVLKTAMGNNKFSGLILDNPYVLYGKKALPPLTLGLAEVQVTLASPKLNLTTAPDYKPVLE